MESRRTSNNGCTYSCADSVRPKERRSAGGKVCGRVSSDRHSVAGSATHDLPVEIDKACSRAVPSDPLPVLHGPDRDTPPPCNRVRGLRSSTARRVKSLRGGAVLQNLASGGGR